MMKKSIRLLVILIIACLKVSAQGQTITGKITTSTGEALPGATILVKGTTNGTTSDADGMYKLVAQDGVLEVSFVGFATFEEPINGRTVINVSLTEDLKSLGEVVVVGYGTQQKKDITGAVSVVGSKEFD